MPVILSSRNREAIATSIFFKPQVKRRVIGRKEKMGRERRRVGKEKRGESSIKIGKNIP